MFLIIFQVELLMVSCTERARYYNLNLLKKYEILQCLWKGESVTRLSENYGVPCSTKNDTKKNGGQIEEFMCKPKLQ